MSYRKFEVTKPETKIRLAKEHAERVINGRVSYYKRMQYALVNFPLDAEIWLDAIAKTERDYPEIQSPDYAHKRLTRIYELIDSGVKEIDLNDFN